MPMRLFAVFCFFAFSFFHAQDAPGTDDAPILLKNSRRFTQPALGQRPALNYKNAPLSDGSMQNRINSPSLTIENPSPGRFGSVRLDGTGAKPLFSVDGFLIRDAAINEGQILIDMLPSDFSESADIYKQNLYPLGVPAPALIDFRLGRGEKYTSLETKAGTIGNWYTKLQGEALFDRGSLIYGLSGDFLLKDYYYAAPDGGFGRWTNSTYQRSAALLKGTFDGWDFLFSNVFMMGWDESATATLDRDNLLAGVRWQGNIARFQTSYNFASLKASYPAGATNQYFGHVFSLGGGARGRKGILRWDVSGGYTYNSIKDAPWAPQKNYLSSPKHGDNSFNVAAELGFSVHPEEAIKPVQAEFVFALNQVASTIYGYTPIPSFTLAVRGRNGVYFHGDISRVYLTPDFTTLFGFGLPADSPKQPLAPKDGLRTGAEIGYSAALGRIYLQASYSWFEKSFRLVNRSNVINVSKVQGLSAELGGDVKIPTGKSALTELALGLAFNSEVDGFGIRSPLLPLMKLAGSLGWRSVEDIWSVRLYYTMHWNIFDGSATELRARHIMDLHLRWRWFRVSVLNLLNQSYRPDPFNPLSAYVPGIRAEFGIKYEWK